MGEARDGSLTLTGISNEFHNIEKDGIAHNIEKEGIADAVIMEAPKRLSPAIPSAAASPD
jgi:hypothetical protein